MPKTINTETLKSYARHLEENGFAYLMAGNQVSVLHARSNYVLNIAEIGARFFSWANENEVAIEDHAEVLKNLPTRVMAFLPRVYGRAMRPVHQNIYMSNRGALLANTYRPYTPEITGPFTMPVILQEYLDRLFPDKSERKLVVQFFADIVQNPMLRPQWALILTGEQGCGKSSIIELVKTALGGNYVWSDNNYTTPFQQYSEILPDNLVVCFDDAPANGHTYEKLKRTITANEVTVEIKFQQNRVEREVYSRVIICSNNTRPLRLEKGDRRFFCPAYCKHKSNADETADFFTRFIQWKDENPTLIYHWLSTVDLSDFVKGSCPKTETHEQMVDLSANFLEDTVSLFLENLHGRAFHHNELHQHLEEHSVRFPSMDVVKAAVLKNGYEMKRRRLRDGDKQIQVYQRSVSGRAPAFTEQETLAIEQALARSF